ncbi:MAG: tyrosine-type recombinase/integrase [Lysobacter sp.]
MAKLRFTDPSIRSLPPATGANRIDYAEADVRGFAVQTTNAGNKRFLLVYVARESGRERRMVLGEFGPAPRLSVSAARRLAGEKRALVDLGGDPWLEAKQSRAQAEASAARETATLAALMTAYVAHLKAAGKASWKEVESSIERNLVKGHPKIAKLQADAVTIDDVMPVFRKLTKAGKWRAAEKLAVYLRAAYSAAKAARLDAGGVAFDGFDIRSNPLLELKVSRPESDREAEPTPALSEKELRAYWKAIDKLHTPHGAMLRFHLLTGGQRMEQLSRLTEVDHDAETGTVTLWDTKGRRKRPRRHVVPLIVDAAAALAAMRGDEPKGPHLFTVSDGAAAAVPHTLAAAMRDVSDLLIDQEKIATNITPGTIRRTVETRLAAVKVPKEIRGQLQSHGLGGIQDRHYDRHHYLDEKREALTKLRALLETPKRGQIIEFPAKTGSSAGRRVD